MFASADGRLFLVDGKQSRVRVLDGETYTFKRVISWPENMTGVTEFKPAKVTALERVRVWYSVPVTSDMTFDALKQAGILIFLALLLVLVNEDSREKTIQLTGDFSAYESIVAYETSDALNLVKVSERVSNTSFALTPRSVTTIVFSE